MINASPHTFASASSDEQLAPASLTKPVKPTKGLRVFELILVAGFAFAPAILFSFAMVNSETTNHAPAFSFGIIQQLSSFALLGYVLFQQGRSVTELGLNFRWLDIFDSLALWVVGLVGSIVFYYALAYLYRLVTSLNYQPKASNAFILGGGFALSALIFVILNPIHEELIVRAYLMTEIQFLTNSGWLAGVVSVIIQTSYHFYQGVIPALSHIPTFVVFALFYAKRKRITPVILAHLYADILALSYTVLWRH